MTTCAWDSRFVAADTMADNNGLRIPVGKIYRQNGKILMGAGDHGQIVSYWKQVKDMSLAEVLELGYPKYDRENNYPGMILVDSANPHLAWNLSGQEWTRLKRKYHAIGSGRDFAMAAMALGRNAFQAVELAVDFDVYSGGEIECLDLA